MKEKCKDKDYMNKRTTALRKASKNPELCRVRSQNSTGAKNPNFKWRWIIRKVIYGFGSEIPENQAPTYDSHGNYTLKDFYNNIKNELKDKGLILNVKSIPAIMNQYKTNDIIYKGWQIKRVLL